MKHRVAADTLRAGSTSDRRFLSGPCYHAGFPNHRESSHVNHTTPPRPFCVYGIFFLSGGPGTSCALFFFLFFPDKLRTVKTPCWEYNPSSALYGGEKRELPGFLSGTTGTLMGNVFHSLCLSTSRSTSGKFSISTETIYLKIVSPLLRYTAIFGSATRTILGSLYSWTCSA